MSQSTSAPVPAPGGRAADALLQHRGGPARAVAAAPPSGHQGPVVARRPGLALPDGADQAGGQRRALHPIPELVRDAYRIYRPSPLVRALGLERSLDTPARIYYKYEGGSPAGSHKQTRPSRGPSTTARRASGGWYRDGCRPVGSALLRRGAVRPGDQGLHGQGRYEQKPYRRSFIQTMGASGCRRRPRRQTPGAPSWPKTPTPRSLGIAISEALEVVATNEDTKYSRQRPQPRAPAPDGHRPGSGKAAGDGRRDGRCRDRLRRRLELRRHRLPVAARPVERLVADALPGGRAGILSQPDQGEYRYDFGDTAGMAPMVKMHTLGHQFRPAPIHAGGLRYHGMAPLVSHLGELGLEARAYGQNLCFEAAPVPCGPRASSRRRSRRTPSGRRSTRPSPPARTATSR